MRSPLLGFAELGHGGGAQLGFQNVTEILLAKGIEAVTGNAAQEEMEKARGADTAGGKDERPQKCHEGHAGAACPAFGKALRVPGKEADGAQGAQFEQAAVHAPIGALARCGRCAGGHR